MRQRLFEVPLEPDGIIRAELDQAEARIAVLRRDPGFLTPGSEVETEHARLSRRAVVLRADLAAGLGRRDPIRPTLRY